MTRYSLIKEAIKDSFRYIKKSPLLFIILFFTQLIFIILMSVVFVFYATHIGEYASKIMESLQNVSEATIYQLPIQDITAASSQFVHSVIMFFVFSYLLYIILNGINWDISNIIVTEYDKILHHHISYALLALLFTIPSMIIINVLSKLFFSLELISAFIIVGLIVLLISVYFMYISFSLIKEYKPKDFGKLLKRAYDIGMTQFRLMFPIYLIMILAIAVPFGLIYLTIEMNFLLLLGSIVLFILGINWSRIFFLTVMEEVKKE
jgi:hypothetical protein